MRWSDDPCHAAVTVVVHDSDDRPSLVHHLLVFQKPRKTLGKPEAKIIASVILSKEQGPIIYIYIH